MTIETCQGRGLHVEAHIAPNKSEAQMEHRN